MRSKQEKEREAAGISPAVRGGSASRGGVPTRGVAPPSRARGGGSGAAKIVARGISSRGRGNSTAGANSRFSGGGGRDSTLWVTLMNTLKKKELLPVVVFTFSKKRCEENAKSMPNLDLCDSGEKSEVHLAIEKSLTRLKGMSSFLCWIFLEGEKLTDRFGLNRRLR